jgi:hypothetical protein
MEEMIVPLPQKALLSNNRLKLSGESVYACTKIAFSPRDSNASSQSRERFSPETI